MKGKIFQKIIALLVLITMTMANFILITNNAISYAVDTISKDVATNHKNIEFSAYFKNSKDEKVSSIEEGINSSNMKLYMGIQVKQQGYFNGKVTVNTSNFTLKETKTDGIQEIKDNVITLNQIKGGEKIEIQLEVEPIKDDEFDLSLLNMESQISLSGIYRDSSEKDIKIEAKRNVTLKWTSYYTKDDNGIQLQSSIITNKIIKIDGQEKKVIQLLIKSGLKDNGFPIKDTKIQLQSPITNALPEKIEVLAKFTNATNPNILSQFSQENWNYNVENNTIEIYLENGEQNKKVQWSKSGQDELIVTCIYGSTENIDETVQISSQINLYDLNNTEMTAKNIISDERQNDGAVMVDIITYDDMYKGKLYAGIAKQYETKTVLNVSLKEAINDISVKENASTYVGENEEVINETYKTTTINKQQVLDILGESGKLDIKTTDGTLVETINKDTQVDENGNVVIQYQNIPEIIVTTTAPVKNGKIELIHIKEIRSQNKEIIKQAKIINTTIETQYNMIADENKYTKSDKITENNQINLLETSTKASLEINKQTLSTVTKNEHVQIKAILHSSNELNDLYKNPSLKITLPEEIQTIEINNVSLVYENELKIKSTKLVGKTIEVVLEGEQTSYKEEQIDGAIILLDLNLTLDKLQHSGTEQIEMTYENQNANSYENGTGIGKEVKQIDIVAPRDIVTINKIDALGIVTVGEETEKIEKISRGSDKLELLSEMEIVNNNEEAIENVKILGTFPTNNQNNNMEINLKSELQIEGIDANKVTIYYTENEQATSDIINTSNGWENIITDYAKVKKYLIVISQMDVSSSIIAKYTFEVPAQLEYNKHATIGYTVTYTNSINKTTSEINATNIKLDTGIGPILEAKLSAQVGAQQIENMQTVKTGEVIKYLVTVSNVGSEDVQNPKIIAKIPEGTVWVEPKDSFEYRGTGYYQEIEKDTYEEIIGNIKAGESITKEYEVRVKNDTKVGTAIKNVVDVTYDDVIKHSEEITNLVETSDIRLTVKRVTDTDIKLYVSGPVQYFAMIENISDKKLENVRIQTNLPQELSVERVTLISGMKEEEPEINDYAIDETQDIQEFITDIPTVEATMETQEIDYNNEINIGTLEKGETKVLSYDCIIQDIAKTSTQIQFSVQTNEVKSNVYTDTINKFDLSINILSNVTSNYVKAGDIVEYTIQVQNNSEVKTSGLTIIDEIPNQMTVLKVEVDGTEISNLNNKITIENNIEAKSQMTIKITAVVDASDSRKEAEIISNKASIQIFGKKVAETAEISHIIEANKNTDGNNNGGNNSGNNNGSSSGDNSQNSNETKTYMISGLAWLDSNENGTKDADETVFSGINVKLLDLNTNKFVTDKDGKEIQTKTNEQGMYVLDKIPAGKYIAIFEYDNTKYKLTTYKKEGVSEKENSNVVLKNLSINDEEKEYSTTDTLILEELNLENINIGLIELKDFDLELNKYVTKMIVQNKKGTITKEYNNLSIAKMEVDAKDINNTTVIVEYKIIVTNKGEVEGYAKKVVDYLSKDFTFSSELNKDWYQTKDGVCNASLSNTKIKPGESKELTLTVTKTMTENNIGLINNTAEIQESYNDSGLTDINSTPGNHVEGENDMGQAEVIISLRTGAVVSYIGLTLFIISVIGIAVYFIGKKVLRKKIK